MTSGSVARDGAFARLEHCSLPGRRPARAIKELMARLGHDSQRAAMIYQHATRERDKTMADGLGQLLRDARTLTG